VRRWLPRLALLLAGVLAIALGGVWYLIATLDLVALEAQAALAVRERTGHDLRLEGLRVQLFPLPSLAVEGLALGPAPGFGPEPLVAVERARARVRLLPLLRGELALGELRLEGARLRMCRNTQGRGSWETLREHLAASAGEGRVEGMPRLQRLLVKDAVVLLEDQASGRRLELLSETLSVEPPDGSGPSELLLLGSLRSTEPAVELELALQARGALDEGALSVDALRVEGTLRGEAVPGGERAFELSAPFTMHLDSGRVELPALAVDSAGLRLQGSAIPEPDGRVEGRLAAESADLRGLLRSLGREPAFEDPTAFSRGRVEGGFAWDGEALRLQGLRLQVDETSVSGAAVLSRLEPPVLWLDLHADRLDLDRYATAGEGGGTPRLPASLRGGWIEGRVAVDRLEAGGLALEDLELPFQLEGAGRLGVEGASASLLGGRLALDLDASLGAEPRFHAQGSLEGLDLAQLAAVSGEEGRISGRLGLELNLWASGAEREALLASLHGRLCLEARDGELPLSSREGGLQREGRFASHARLAEERAALIRERAAARIKERLGVERPSRLHYRHIGGCFGVQQGVASSIDLLIDADELRLDGAGEIDLPGEAVDIGCRITMGDLPPMDLLVKGSMDDPQITLDRPEALELARHRVEQQRAALRGQVEEQRAVLQERRAELRDELREKASPGVEKLLDQREQALERRDELRDKVQEARQGLRGKWKQARGGSLEEGESEELSPREGAEAPPSPDPEEQED
jgi:AsmA protein